MAPTGTGASRWSWSGVVCGPTGPRSVPSCVTWACRPPGHGQKSEPRCRPRTWTSARTCSGGTSPLTSPARSCAGTFPRKREVPPPTSGRGPDSSIWRPFWTAVLRRSWVMRWPTTCTRPWCARPLTWRYAGARSRRVRRSFTPTGAASTRPRSSWTTSSLMVFVPRWGARECAGTTLGLQSFNATLKNERVHRMVYPTKDKAIKDIASWIELRYNHVRLHSALGYRTPNEAENDFLDLKKAA